MTLSYDNKGNRIGTNCHFHRVIQELSISDLAEASGLTFEVISGIEDYSRTQVTSSEVRAIASAFKIPEKCLLDEYPHPHESEQPFKDLAMYNQGLSAGKRIQAEKGHTIYS